MNTTVKRMLKGLATIAASAPLSFATNVSGNQNGLPWEGALQQIQNSMQGPVAFAIAIIAMAAAGATLVFGGEISEFTRKACFLVLAIAFLVGGASLMKSLFNVSGALI